jgi:LacI family transcriptional regulator
MDKRQKTPSEPRPNSATAFDVARLAGVTQATVSRAINRPEAVAPKTRQRILHAMAALNYKPSAAARGLARGRNGVIGLLIQGGSYNADRLGLLTLGVGQVVGAEHYLLSLAMFTSESRAEELANCPLLAQRTCDGFLIDLEGIPDLPDLLQGLTVPYVLINPAVDQPVDAVFPNDRRAAELAVNYLISKGHRRIAYLTGTGSLVSVRARREGYELAMYRDGLSPFPIPEIPSQLTDLSIPHVIRHAEKLRLLGQVVDSWLADPDPPTAVVCYDGPHASRLAELAYQRGWRLPETFSIVACDDELPLQRGALPITAVDLRRDVIGSEAVRMLMAKLAAPDRRIPSRRIDGCLLERDSVLDRS